MFLSKYGAARHIYVPVIKAGANDFAKSADWTPAAGDVKISKDGGAAANVTNLPTAITMGNGAMWDFSLTATEMQAAQILVTVVDAATKAVEDQMLVIETYGNASGQHAFDLNSATVTPGANSITSSVIAANAIGASQLATAAIVAATFAAGAIDSGALDATAANEIRDSVWAKTGSEPASVPNFTADALSILEWLFALSRNKRTQTATTELLRTSADSATIGTSTKSDDGTTFVRNKYT